MCVLVEDTRSRAEAGGGTHLGAAGARAVLTVRGRGPAGLTSLASCATGPAIARTCCTSSSFTTAARASPKSFAWSDCRDLIVAIHQRVGTTLVWCWGTLNVHLVAAQAGHG
jgi:hypothetical protein